MSTFVPADDWAPDACTLPTVEQPLRLAEFDELFTGSLRGIERVEPTRLRLRLDGTAEAVARDLTAREASCCSFFGFQFDAEAGGGAGAELRLDVTVPPAYVDVLDALALRAAGAADLTDLADLAATGLRNEFSGLVMGDSASG